MWAQRQTEFSVKDRGCSQPAGRALSQEPTACSFDRDALHTHWGQHGVGARVPHGLVRGQFCPWECQRLEDSHAADCGPPGLHGGVGHGLRKGQREWAPLFDS